MVRWWIEKVEGFESGRRGKRRREEGGGGVGVGGRGRGVGLGIYECKR